MNINTEIIDKYFAEKSIKSVKDHWIFSSIVKGKHLCEEPKTEDYNKLKNIYEIIVDELNNFKPRNLTAWKSFLGDYVSAPKEVNIYLIVGAPDPYDAMVMEDKQGNDCIIFDLKRMSSYSDNNLKVIEIINGIISHELVHTIIHKKYGKHNNTSFMERLKYLVFDEGIAHFIGYNGDPLSIDWNNNDFILKKEKAYSTLMQEISNYSFDKEEDILERSNSGRYWDKFGSISGLFSIVDYYYANNKDLSCLSNIYEGGPEFTWEIIKNYSKGV